MIWKDEGMAQTDLFHRFDGLGKKQIPWKIQTTKTITQLNKKLNSSFLKPFKVEILGLDGFNGKSYQTFKEELIAPPKIFQEKTNKLKNTGHSFY